VVPSVSWVLTRRFDPYDAVACARAHDVLVAGKSLGRPWHHPPSVAESVLEWRHDDPGERTEMWEAVTHGLVVGIGTIWLTLDDNVEKAWVEVVVDPAHRRRGAARALTERLVSRAREAGRTEVLTEVVVPPGCQEGDGHPYLHCAEALGFATTSTDVERHLRLPVDPPLLNVLEAQARPHWEQGYRLATYHEGVPEHLQEGLCAVMNRLGVDAPTGEVSYEPESLTPRRYLDNVQLLVDQGRSLLTTVAAAVATGDVVAYTDLALPAAPNPVAWQWGTLVDAAHRGHRLGMAVKVANLRVRNRDHPGRELVVTSNDETNRWMVDVNDALGFEMVELVPTMRRMLP